MSIIQEQANKMLKLALVQRAIFCPFTGEVLDIDTAKFLVDRDGDPAYVMSPSAFEKITAVAAVAEGRTIVDELAGMGIFIPKD